MSGQLSGDLASEAEVQSATRKANGSVLVSLAALLVSIISAYYGYVNANTAGNALRLSEIDRERTERAYLSIGGERLLRFKAGHTIKLAIDVHNMGHTPALRAKFVARWRSRSQDAVPKPIDEALASWRDDPNASSINESYSKSFISIAPLTQAQYNLIKSGKQRLEFALAVRYVDVFGKYHTTRLCATYGKFPSGEWDSGRCKIGNNAD